MMFSCFSFRFQFPVCLFLGLFLASSVFGQRFEFSQQQYSARSGDVLPLEIRLHGVSEPLNAVSFALRVSESTGELCGLQNAQGVSANLSSFTDYYQHITNYVPTNQGLNKGRVIEYRAVVQATDSSKPFTLEEDTAVAIVNLPIAHEGAGKVIVELIADVDQKGVPLCSAILGTGEYWKDAEGRGPAGDFTTIIINEKAIPALDDLTLLGAENRWVIESSKGVKKGRFMQNHGMQLMVEERFEGTLLRPLTELFGPWRGFVPDTLAKVEWSITRPKDIAASPYRFGGRQQFGEITFSELTNTEEKAKFNAWIQNSEEFQVNPFFQLIAPETGEPSSILVSSVESFLIPLSQLEGRQLEYNQRFSKGNQAAWTPVQTTELVELVAGEKGLEVSFLADETKSLEPANDQPLDIRWQLNPSRSTIKLNAKRLYQLEATVYFSPESRSAQGAAPQVILSTNDYSFSSTTQLTASRVLGEKQQVSTWFELPESANGKVARLEFVYHNGRKQLVAGERVALDSIKLTSYKLP
jgi:hypothetical protein